ncbi:MAG: SpoIID/LytB domain-containing protein [Gemmatimonadetes bacterium]|nr:SpoIID/LytB domain-containing protein [Gemmatimonadota bacterium]
MRRQTDEGHGLLKGRPDIFAWAPSRVDRRRTVHRLAQAAPLLIVAAACLLAAGTLTSCTPDPVVVPLTPPPDRAPIIRVLLTAAPVAKATITTTGGYQLLAGGKLLTESKDLLGRTNVSLRDGVWRFAGLTTRGRTLVLKAVGTSTINLAATSYRGQMHFLPRGAGEFVVVNHVPLDDYLAGVLPKELIHGWHIETYRAQAIAARTFATYHKVTFGRTHDYDVGDSTSWQVYGGFTAQTDKAVRAVESTRGQVLLAGPPGRERIFMAQYSACNGGYVNGANVIRDVPPLAVFAGGQIDPDGRRCPRFRWAPVRISKADIYRALMVSYQKAAALKRVEQIRVVGRAGKQEVACRDRYHHGGYPKAESLLFKAHKRSNYRHLDCSLDNVAI